MTLPFDYARCAGHMQTRSDRFFEYHHWTNRMPPLQTARTWAA